MKNDYRTSMFQQDTENKGYHPQGRSGCWNGGYHPDNTKPGARPPKPDTDTSVVKPNK